MVKALRAPVTVGVLANGNEHTGITGGVVRAINTMPRGQIVSDTTLALSPPVPVRTGLGYMVAFNLLACKPHAAQHKMT